MSGRLLPAADALFTASATAAGVVTVASNAGFTAGTIGYLSDATGASQQVKVISLNSTTGINVRKIPRTDPTDPSVPIHGTNFGLSDVSAFVLTSKLGFDIGTAAFTPGDTVTGGTSGATAVIIAVVIASGSFVGGDAAGTLVIKTVAGGPFQDDEALTDPGGGSATAAGVNSITSRISAEQQFIYTAQADGSLPTKVP
jgi:hypothetical protein